MRRGYAGDAEANDAGSGSAGIVEIAGKLPRGVLEGDDGDLLLPADEEQITEKRKGSKEYLSPETLNTCLLC